MTWKIFALRTFLILYVVGDVVMMSVALAGTLIGNSEYAITLLDCEGDIPNDIQAPLWGVAVTLVLTIFYIYCVIRLFLALDKLVVGAYHGALASFDTAQTMRRLGKSLIGLWIALILVEIFVPLALFWETMMTGDVDITFAPFDLKVVLALLGFALWLVAGLAEEADNMKKELSGVV